MRVGLGRMLVVSMVVACGGKGGGGGGDAPGSGGLRGNGAHCLASSECESQRCDNTFVNLGGPVPTRCGTCVPFGASDGSACAAVDACARGESCVGAASGAGTCVPEATAGQACDGSGAIAPVCGPQLWCDTTQHCSPGGCPSYSGHAVECPTGTVCEGNEGGFECSTVVCADTGSGTQCKVAGIPVPDCSP